MSETGPPSGAVEIHYTVTYLEMTAPARRAVPRPAEPLALMRAERPPTHFFLYLYKTVGADYLWTDMLAWSPEDLAAFVQDPAVELVVLYARGAPAGFYQLDLREAGAVNLAYFGIMPEAVGRGLGPWLLSEALRDAWSRDGVERVTVNTCTLDHPSALAMYQRAGFSPIRREERVRTG